MLFPLDSKYLKEEISNFESNNKIQSSLDNFSSNFGISKSLLFDFIEFKHSFLDLLNEKRRLHKVENLTENWEISAQAKIHAEKLADQENFFSVEKKLYMNEKLGEIVYIISGAPPKAENVISAWYNNQSRNYDWENPELSKGVVTNFTQLLWKNTKEIGLGYGMNSKGKYYIVANFWPCGNIRGEERMNVFKSD